MAAPTFGAAGAAVASLTTGLNVAYPAGIQAGHILVLVALTRDNVEISTPAGWTQHPILGFRNQSVGLRVEWFWKRAVGNESGTLAISRATSTTCFFARMFRFAGIANGNADPFEALAASGATSATITPADITTLGRERLIVCLVGVADDNALANFTGGTATVPEAVAEATTPTGTDAAIGCWALSRDEPEVFDFGTQNMAGSDAHCSFTFALLPAAEAMPSKSAPGLDIKIGRHPNTLEVSEIAYANTSGFPMTATLWRVAGTATVQSLAGNQTAGTIVPGTGYVWDETQAGLNINIRYQ